MDESNLPMSYRLLALAAPVEIILKTQKVHKYFMKATRSLVISRWLIAIVFCAAGILHFLFPAPYARIIPPLFPAPHTLVLISGVCEILGGLGVLLPQLRRMAGYGLIALLIAVFPANIYMAMQQQQAQGWTLGTVLLVLRLPLQFLLMAWVYRSAVAKIAV